MYPVPSEEQTVEFPYLIYFDKIVNATDLHVAGFAHDETVKWAAKAQAEMQGEDTMAGSFKYYREIALQNSYKTDARSAPRRLGYCGNPRSRMVPVGEFREHLKLPSVTFT